MTQTRSNGAGNRTPSRQRPSPKTNAERIFAKRMLAMRVCARAPEHILDAILAKATRSNRGRPE
jgi:hypothetical protein